MDQCTRLWCPWVGAFHKQIPLKNTYFGPIVPVECELHKYLPNNFICHLSWLKKLSLPHTNSLTSICEIFKTLQVIIFWVRVNCKMLNVNCIKIHSIILSITCQGLINFPPLIQIPLYPFVNFQNPVSYYFLS